MTKLLKLSNHTIALDEERGSVAISGPSGAGVVEIALTAEGALIRVHAQDVTIAAPERLTLATDRFELRAREARFEIEGDLDERVGGASRRIAAGAASIAGHDLLIAAPEGEIRLQANDDVDIRGERVRLNCDDPPMPLTWEEHDRRRVLRTEGES